MDNYTTSGNKKTDAVWQCNDSYYADDGDNKISNDDDDNNNNKRGK